LAVGGLAVVQLVQATPEVPQVVVVAAKQLLPLQQPAEHDALVHWHMPFTHCCPAPHGAPEPHRHAPAVQVSPVMRHEMHALPLEPHDIGPGAVQMLLTQQPEAHEAEVQRQVPPTHWRPAPQAGPLPQPQVPLLQTFATSGVHAVQLPPLVPQAEAFAIWQVPLRSQQPFGQEVELQPQLPAGLTPVHCWPAPHALALPPHTHTRLALQVLLLPLQTAQAAPAFPHAAAVVPVWHLPVMSQQPVEHVDELQMQVPPWHFCPAWQAGPPPQLQVPLVQPSANCAVHAMHALPPPPQLPAVVCVTQVVPLQQPVEHEVVLHWQVPFTHCWPGRQAGPAPQRQLPLVQLFPSVPQLRQVAPVMPHADCDGAVQVVPEQQPVGHEVESQMQAP
jgi:hypothetical protein